MKGTRPSSPSATDEGVGSTASDADALDGDEKEVAFRPRRVGRPRPARTYVRVTRTARIVLVGLALMIVAVIVIWPQIQPRVDRLRIGMASLEVIDGQGQGLVNARLTGSDAEGQPYELTARFVRQLEDSPALLGLDRPRGQIRMKDGSVTVITAASGRFHQQAKLLELYGDVTLETGDGSRYETAAATFDLAAGTASGTEPVHGRGPLGTVTGEGFRATNFGQTIFVEGRSTLVVTDPGQDAPS